MNKTERAELLKKIAELRLAIGKIEKDSKAHDDLNRLCSKMLEIVRGGEEEK